MQTPALVAYVGGFVVAAVCFTVAIILSFRKTRRERLLARTSVANRQASQKAAETPVQLDAALFPCIAADQISTEAKLIDAVQNGDVAGVHECLGHGVSPNATSGSLRWSVLHEAVSRERESIVIALCEAGADVNSRTRMGTTALQMAAEKGYATIAHILIERGADLEATSSDKGTALMIAVQAGNSDVVRVLLKAGARTDVTEQFGEGLRLTPLGCAQRFLANSGEKKYERVIKALLE